MTEARPRSVRQQFAHRLKELRHARGFRTARSLAQALAIDENRYTRYERAEVEPDLALLVRICQALGATPNDLLGDGGQPGGERRIAGFAEPAGTALAPRPPPPAGPAERDSARARRRALAWQLAGEWAKARAQPGAPLAALQAKSRLFADIERDPFAALARLADDPALAALPPGDQARLAALTDELIAAVMDLL
jgi:transcriptional regulator with XRE-family HTH domain